MALNDNSLLGRGNSLPSSLENKLGWLEDTSLVRSGFVDN